MSAMSTMVDLQPLPGGGLALSWADAPGACDRVVSVTEITRLQHLVEALSIAEERGRSAVTVEARTALRGGLFALLDGPDQDLADRLNVAGLGQQRFDLVVRALAGDDGALGSHPATWMRWELLAAPGIEPAGAPGITVVLQLGPAEIGAPRVLDHRGLRILFMAFSPSNASPELDFEHEEEALLSALAPLAEQRRARMRVVEEGTLDGLGAVLAAERFDVVHLSGHGRITPEGPRLVMEDAFGAGRLVSPAKVIEVLKRARTMPQLVMLSTCHSAEVRGATGSFAAALVAAGVPNVLGWTRPVRDDQATLAASTVYEQLGAGKTPVEAAEVTRERMRRSEARSPAPTHAWSTLHLVSSAAGGFRVDEGAEPLEDPTDRDEVYTYLRGRMRVLERGFVGRRRLVQRLLRVVLRGQVARPERLHEVAGACVFGMRGVGKSCTVARVIERAKQVVPGLRVVLLHGVLDEQTVHGAFQEAIATGSEDVAAKRFLGRVDEPLVRRVQRIMDLWREREVVIVLDDFEQNLERRSDGPWRPTADAAALLDAMLPACAAGKPKLLITSTAEFEVRGEGDKGIAFVPLGSFDAAAVQKLWMRGQASNELAFVSLRSWQSLAERLGRNARILGWARSLCAGKADGEMAEVAERAALSLPVWGPGDESTEEKQTELARLFLQHMAHCEARAAFGEDALLFVKRARVFEAAVPREAFTAMVEGLDVSLERDLGALASWGLLEVGEMDGERAYRVSPLVEPTFDPPEPARWHEAASAAWEALAENAASGAAELQRREHGWEHALRAGSDERAVRLAKLLSGTLERAGLYADNMRLAKRHLERLPDSWFGLVWAGYAECQAGRPGPRATEHIRRGHALLVRALGTEEHKDVADSLRDLGIGLRNQGDLTGAREALERSLAIRTRLFGPDDASVAGSWHELAILSRDQGDIAGARQALERSLAIKTMTLAGREDHNLSATLHELGGILRIQGELDRARGMLERSIAIKVHEHGTEEHPDIAASLYLLGSVLLAQGELAGARQLLERSLAINAKVLGTEEHPAVAASLRELGLVLMRQGDLTRARQVLDRSLMLKIRVLGTEQHPAVASSMHDLGVVLREQGDLAGARRLLERSLAIKINVLGTEEHHNVATGLQVLGVLLREQGDLAGARQALERSIAIHTKVLGTEEHSLVATSLHELGHVLEDRGDPFGARRALERSLAIHTKVLGTEEHPDIATCLHALGRVLGAQRLFPGARRALERSIAIRTKALGTEEHPHVALTYEQLASVLGEAEQLEEAVAAYRRALQIRDRCFGTRDNPDSAHTEIQLALLLLPLRHTSEARTLIQHALRILEQQWPDHPFLREPDLRRMLEDVVHHPALAAPERQLCPCGSGEPFSDCHGKPDGEPSA